MNHDLLKGCCCAFLVNWHSDIRFKSHILTICSRLLASVSICHRVWGDTSWHVQTRNNVSWWLAKPYKRLYFTNQIVLILVTVNNTQLYCNCVSILRYSPTGLWWVTPNDQVLHSDVTVCYFKRVSLYFSYEQAMWKHSVSGGKKHKVGWAQNEPEQACGLHFLD